MKHIGFPLTLPLALNVVFFVKSYWSLVGKEEQTVTLVQEVNTCLYIYMQLVAYCTTMTKQLHVLMFASLSGCLGVTVTETCMMMVG